jgi:hypothetical protein
MTSIDFLETVYDILNDQNYRISFSPAKNKNWMMECNGNFIGGLFDDELCLVHTDAGSTLMNHPEPIYRGYSKNSQHKMLSVPIEIAKKMLCSTYGERFDGNTFIFDMLPVFRANSKYSDNIIQYYDLFAIFVRFCYDKELLVMNPLDKKGRIIHMRYVNSDLTKKGRKVFTDLLHSWLVYTDRTNKIDNIKMLEKYYLGILQKTETA